MCLAKPLQLISIDENGTTGLVSAGGTIMPVGLELVPEAAPGDYVLVHAGMAIELLDESDAVSILEAYEEYIEGPNLLAPGLDDNVV
jgi:hydrogenase expression/formation protein HypC